jgi:hypothetical protein
MTEIKTSTVWAGYFATYIGGLAALVYLARTAPASWATVSLPFAFGIILVAIGAAADHVGADVPQSPPSGPLSLLGGPAGGIQRDPQRPVTIVAWTVVCLMPWAPFLFPASVQNPRIDLILTVWFLASGAFSGLVLPRLVKPRSSLTT